MTEKIQLSSQKKETLARKQKERIRMVRSLRSRLPKLPPQWWGRNREGAQSFLTWQEVSLVS